MTKFADDLLEMVITPVLNRLGKLRPEMNTDTAAQLLLGTAAQESAMGARLRQAGGGPARGIYQIEPATFFDLIDDLTNRHRHPDILSAMSEWASPLIPYNAQIAGNLYYATAVARVNYWRKPAPLPAYPDARSLGEYWKRWWNTPLGAGTVDQFVANYRRYVTG